MNTLLAPGDIIAQLPDAYLPPGDPGSWTYLLENPDILSFLADAAPQLRKYFGSEVKIRLEMFRAPDDPGDVSLYALVLTLDLPAIARPKYDRFESEWWINVLNSVAPRLNFALEYFD